MKKDIPFNMTRALFWRTQFVVARSAWLRGHAMSDEDDCLDEELRVQGQPRLHRGCALLVEGPLQALHEEITGRYETSLVVILVMQALHGEITGKYKTALAIGLNSLSLSLSHTHTHTHTGPLQRL